LAQVLQPLQQMFDPADYPDLLVGLGVPDDAAVYRLDDERALIVTTDFFTPVVDDPRAYGAIAAANALSDVYATGGRPLLALNLVAMPTDLPPGILDEILLGAAEKVREAGAVIAGGHSIQDKEPKFGLAVVGLGDPERLLTKSGAKAGDRLVLTKPLGTGCITTAAKQDKADAGDLAEAIRWMSHLNRAACQAACGVGARAATDVTGYGLLGHASEMAEASDVTLQIDCARVPWMQGVERYAAQNIFPGGSRRNQQAYQDGIRFADPITPQQQLLLFDAQTSGGLLIAVPANQHESFAAEMQRREESWWEIGSVGEREDVDVVVRA